jgi:hypothetical protein
MVPSVFSIKSWLARTPTVEEARPARCPCCGVASRPVGQRLNLHGHGLRDRQVRGPLEVGGAPKLVVLWLRRYLCRCCQASVTVGPLGLVAHRLFSVAALGLALYLWGCLEQTAGAVREQVDPLSNAGGDPMGGWRQLGRWVQALREGRLLGGLLPGELPAAVRAVAQRAAAALAARCPAWMCGEPLPKQVFAGGALGS